MAGRLSVYMDRLRNIGRAAVGAPTMQAASLMSPPSNRGWMTVFDTTPGAWQQDSTPANLDKALAHWAVFACLTLIAKDAAKLCLDLREEDENGIWTKTRSGAFSPVLRKPNGYQTRQQFIQSWVLSKLGPAGNTYVLKQRDARGIVVEMHVLDPMKALPLIAPNGSVFYQLGADDLAKVRFDADILPASEIIHDRSSPLFHPLVGISPLYACGLSASQGLRIQENSERFFRNRSMPGGIITAPARISDDMAERIKREFNQRYSGENAGKTAVLGDGLKYEPHSVNARDSQLIEQLGLTAKMVCSTYHVPPFKIGIEALPAGQKVEDMDRRYYRDCLQDVLESIEALLDEGLGLNLTGRALRSEFDTDDLMRMDQASMVTAIAAAIGAGAMKPNEGRHKMNLPPVDGGDTPYLQEQNYSLAALAKRDARLDPWGASASAAPPMVDKEPDEDIEETVEALARDLPSLVRKAA